MARQGRRVAGLPLLRHHVIQRYEDVVGVKRLRLVNSEAMPECIRVGASRLGVVCGDRPGGRGRAVERCVRIGQHITPGGVDKGREL